MTAGLWAADWMWALPLIGLTTVIHAAGLALTGDTMNRLFGERLGQSSSLLLRGAVTATAALLLAMLQAIDALAWALACLTLGVLPTLADAVYFRSAQ